MAGRFTEMGIPSPAVPGETTQAERIDAVVALRECRINAIFSCDVFNEGIEIPEVDTVMSCAQPRVRRILQELVVAFENSSES